MLCEKCEKNQATFHYTEVVNGVKNEHHLCSECAANTDMSYYSTIFDNDQFGKVVPMGNARIIVGVRQDFTPDFLQYDRHNSGIKIKIARQMNR